MLKRCYKCKTDKFLDCFHISKTSKDGRQNCCRDCKSVVCQRYYKGNSENIKKNTNIYYHCNKSKRVNWENTKYKNDLLFKLKKRLRHRLRSAFYRLERHKSRGSAIKDLGCSITKLRSYLESKFLPGMSWDNWTSDGWHIDHIVPLSSATTEEELIKLCHYTNLQPLWAKDNISKGGII